MENKISDNMKMKDELIYIHNKIWKTTWSDVKK